MGWGDGFDALLNGLKNIHIGNPFAGIGAGARSNGNTFGTPNAYTNLNTATPTPSNPYVSQALHQLSPYGKLQQANTIPEPGTPEYRAYLRQTLLGGVDAGQPNIQSLKALTAQGTKSASALYDPQIQALYKEMSRAKGQAGKNRKDLGGLYSTLASSYLGDIKTSKADTKTAKGTESKALKNLQKQVGDQYSQSLGDQAKEFQKLGITDALPSATAGQKDDLNFLSSVNASESGAQQRALDLQGAGDNSYYQQGQGIAKTEGAQNIADMMAQLNTYLSQEGSQVSGLQGQKSAAIQDYINKAQTGQSAASTKWESDRWNRLMQMANLSNADIKAQNANGTQIPTKGVEGAKAVLDQMLGKDSQKGYSDLMSLFQTQPFREGQIPGANNNMVKLSAHQSAAEVRKWGAAQHLPQSEIDALILAVYTYNGQLK